MAKYKTLEEDLDSIRLLLIIKKLVYTGDTNYLNPKHNRTMARMNLINLYQDRFQDIQEFRDQYKAMKKVCNEHGLHFSRCKEVTKALLAEKCVTSPTKEQLKKTLDAI